MNVEGSEIIKVTVQFDKTKKLHFTSYYRPPTQDGSFLDLLDDVLSKLCNICSGFPHIILEESAFELAPILALYFQQSFDEGTLPSAWRDTNITATFKNGHSADSKNYRAVPLTSLITMEHFICKQICSHLSRNSVISQHQHGFQKGLSCENQLITVTHEWASILNIRWSCPRDLP